MKERLYLNSNFGVLIESTQAENTVFLFIKITHIKNDM